MTPPPVTGIRSAVVVAPHPDDEIIGAFGLISRLRARGSRVRVIVVTNGAASHPASRRFDTKRLTATRMAESRRGLARAGVAPAQVSFLGHGDGTLHGYDANQIRALRRDLAVGLCPDLLVLPVRRDDHADHRAVARAGIGLWPRCRYRLGYRVWPLADRPAPPAHYALTLDSAAWHRKRAALACHRSQTGLIDDDPNGFTMSHDQRVRFCRPVEYFSRLA